MREHFHRGGGGFQILSPTTEQTLPFQSQAAWCPGRGVSLPTGDLEHDGTGHKLRTACSQRHK